MARYDYRFAPASAGQIKLLESLSWGAIGVFILFTMALFRLPTFNHLLQANWPLYIGSLALMYLLFMLPSRRMLKLRKYETTWLETSRKGLTMHGKLPPGEEGTEKTLAWRDVTRARVTLDVKKNVGVYMRRLEIVYGKNRVFRLDNEAPKFTLNGDLALLAEMQERVRDVEQTFVWYYPVCPYCRTAPLASGEPCKTCGQIVKFRQKLGRPQDVWGEDTPYLLLFLLFATLGGRGALMGSIIGSCMLWSLVVPLLFSRPATLQTIQVRRQAEPAAAEA